MPKCCLSVATVLSTLLQNEVAVRLAILNAGWSKVDFVPIILKK
jgi:hypothetical protein